MQAAPSYELLCRERCRKTATCCVSAEGSRVPVVPVVPAGVLVVAVGDAALLEEGVEAPVLLEQMVVVPAVKRDPGQCRRVDVAGQGAPLVLMHGFSGSRDTWRSAGFVDRLRDSFTVILPDARGHGASTAPHDPEAYDLTLLAGDVVAVLDHAGEIGMALAELAPNRLRSLILGGAGATWTPDPSAPDEMLALYERGVAEGVEVIIAANREWFGGITPEGGTFTSIGGAPASRVAVWNGTAWSALGGGVGNRVFDLKRYRGELFATGEFTTAEGSPAAYVARWNGTAWSAMGSGLNARGFALAVYRDTLFVGGDFTQAGGRYAVGVSSWATAGAVDAGEPAPRSALGLRATPSPFADKTTLRWSLPHASHVRAQVFDLAGRVLATLHDGALPAGTHARAWDGRDADGRAAPPGVYLVRVTAGDHVEHGRVVRLR